MLIEVLNKELNENEIAISFPKETINGTEYNSNILFFSNEENYCFFDIATYNFFELKEDFNISYIGSNLEFKLPEEVKDYLLENAKDKKIILTRNWDIEQLTEENYQEFYEENKNIINNMAKTLCLKNISQKDK